MFEPGAYGTRKESDTACDDLAPLQAVTLIPQANACRRSEV